MNTQKTESAYSPSRFGNWIKLRASRFRFRSAFTEGVVQGTAIVSIPCGAWWIVSDGISFAGLLMCFNGAFSAWMCWLNWKNSRE